jgi:hypothetical protein
MGTELEFLRQTSDRFKEAFERALKAISQLDDRQLWLRPSSQSNSVGIILQHLIGNLNQWICAGVGGADFQRNRPEEFRDNPGRPKDELIKIFRSLGGTVEDVISRVPPESLLAPRRIQNSEVTVLSALYKALAHFEFHEGQILYIAKLLLNENYVGIWGPAPTPK